VIKFCTLDSSGDTELLEKDTTREQMEAMFTEMTTGKGYLAALGSMVDEAEQVRSFREVTDAADANPTQDLTVTFIPRLVGG
jgi:hypothetical protein